MIYYIKITVYLVNLPKLHSKEMASSLPFYTLLCCVFIDSHSTSCRNIVGESPAAAMAAAAAIRTAAAAATFIAAAAKVE